jgi:enoyl-CoA hydratase
MNISRLFDRRSLVKAGAFLGGVSAAFARAASADAEERSLASEATTVELTMAEIPLSATANVTVECRGRVVLIGINRPYIHNRIDSETCSGLATDHMTTILRYVLRCSSGGR